MDTSILHDFSNLILWRYDPESGYKVFCSDHNFLNLSRAEIGNRLCVAGRFVHKFSRDIFIKNLKCIRDGYLEENNFVCRVEIERNYYKDCLVGFKKSKSSSQWSGYIVNIDDELPSNGKFRNSIMYESFFHDLNTPVSTIEMNLSLLKNYSENFSEQYSKKIERIILRLNRSVAEIKNILKSEVT